MKPRAVVDSRHMTSRQSEPDVAVMTNCCQCFENLDKGFLVFSVYGHMQASSEARASRTQHAGGQRGASGEPAHARARPAGVSQGKQEKQVKHGKHGKQREAGKKSRESTGSTGKARKSKEKARKARKAVKKQVALHGPWFGKGLSITASRL